MSNEQLEALVRVSWFLVPLIGCLALQVWSALAIWLTVPQENRSTGKMERDLGPWAPMLVLAHLASWILWFAAMGPAVELAGLLAG